MQVDLNRRDEEIVAAKLHGGRYQRPEEVVSAALALFDITPTSHEDLIRMVEDGLSELDAGRGIAWDMNAFLKTTRNSRTGESA